MENKNLLKIAVLLSVIAIIISIYTIITNYNADDIAVPSDEKHETTGSNIIKANQIPELPSDLGIAYVDLDVLLSEYKLSRKLNEDLLEEQAKSQASLEREIRNFERDYQNFMEKAQSGSFLSQASMEAQQNELVQKQQQIEMLDQQLSENLLRKQAQMNEQLYDTIMNFMKEFNEGKYTLVLGNAAGANVLYAKPEMNITKQVTDALNDRYNRRFGN